MLVEVIAPHVYDDRARRVGERYECNPQYLPLLVTLGWVALPKAQPEKYYEAAIPENVSVHETPAIPRASRRRKAATLDIDPDPAA